MNDRKIRALNRQYRGIDSTTDVLSFSQIEHSQHHYQRSISDDFVLGDIVINLHKAKRQAEEHGISFHDEVKQLLIHGLVHLMGYDHELNRNQEMRMKYQEKKLLKYL